MQIRKSARGIILNENNEILLEKFEFKDVVGNKVLWVTPGGGIQEPETPVETLKRELKEELGIAMANSGEPIFAIDVLIEGKKGHFISRETYFKITLHSNTTLSFDNMTDNEKDTFKDLKWWSKKKIKTNRKFCSS